MKDPATRLRRFKALVAVNRDAIPQWQPAKLPFTRPLYDIASILARVQVEPDGSPSVPSLRSAWAWIFESAELPARSPRARASAADDGLIDAAWLAQMIVSLDTRDRGERIDQLAFGQRVFGHAEPDDNASVLTAIRAFPRFRMLLLALERSGVRHPAVYMSAARRAQQLSSLDNRRLFVALGQFQSALALIARMASVHTLDVAATESLITSLASVSPNNDGRYGGAIVTWMQQTLRPALVARLQPDATSDSTVRPGSDLDLEELVLQAVAGVLRTRAGRRERRGMGRGRLPRGCRGIRRAAAPPHSREAGRSIARRGARARQGRRARRRIDGVDIRRVDCRRRQPGAADRRCHAPPRFRAEPRARTGSGCGRPGHCPDRTSPSACRGTSPVRCSVWMSRSRRCRCGASAATGRLTRRRSRPTSATRLRSRWRC